jgi:hypothetical protein
MSNLKDQVVVMGDIHGDFGGLNTFINKHQPGVVLQCGDFGYFPHMTQTHLDALGDITPVRMGEVKTKNTHVHWCDGNHEDHEALLALDDLEVFPGVFYQPRGSTLVLPDGRTVLFVGGADSVDKGYRTRGVDWFPEELITHADINRLPDPKAVNIDIVVSHTCPVEFIQHSKIAEMTHFAGKVDDPSCRVLSHVLQVYQPSLWYFGHWHVYDTGYVLGCRWTALDMSWSERYWEVIR